MNTLTMQVLANNLFIDAQLEQKFLNYSAADKIYYYTDFEDNIVSKGKTAHEAELAYYADKYKDAELVIEHKVVKPRQYSMFGDE